MKISIFHPLKSPPPLSVVLRVGCVGAETYTNPCISEAHVVNASHRFSSITVSYFRFDSPAPALAAAPGFPPLAAAACADVSPTRAKASFSGVRLLWFGAHVRDSWQEQDAQRESEEERAKEVGFKRRDERRFTPMSLIVFHQVLNLFQVI